MTETLSRGAFRDRFTEASVDRLSRSVGDPAWLKARRQRALAAFQAGAAKDRPDTGARWLREPAEWLAAEAEPGPALELPAVYGPELDGEWGPLAGAMSYVCEGAPQVVLDAEARAAGVTFVGLREALASHGDLVERHLFSRTAEDETVYAALNAAYLSQGAFLVVPKGVRLERPLRVRAVHTGGHAGLFPRTLVLAGEGSAVTLIEEVHSAGAAPGLASSVAELILGADARVNYIHLQALNGRSGAVQRQSTVLAADARLYTLGMVVGGAWSTSYLGTRIEGGGASVDLLGLALGRGKQRLEIRTLQDHVGRSGASDALVKSILRGASRFHFDGVVRIQRSGQNTDAFQSNPNLLLSSEARAESVPTLEIEADDVACKHAASIGGIDEDERFYLLSRGISPRETETMITEGFAAELAQRLPDGDLQDRFVRILNRLASAE